MQRTYEMSVDSSVATRSCRSVENFWLTLMKPFLAGAAGCSSRAVKRCLTSGLPTAWASQRDECIESLFSSRKWPAVYSTSPAKWRTWWG